MIYTDDNYIKATLMKRDRDAHKGNFGKILIFAGSLGMAGAAVLCGKAALRTGSGLVQFLLPKLPCEIYPILQTAVPEATCIAFREDMLLDQYDAIACGSGIGQSDEARHILKMIIENYGRDALDKKEKTLLLDADALNLISKEPALEEAVKNAKATIIITPHVGEAKRLLNSCAGISGFTARKNAVCDLSLKYNCIAVLKGSGTLVGAFPGAFSKKNPALSSSFEVFENTTGNPGMATGGSGDSLSGIIVSLAGQGYAPLDAARMGVFLHGKAGDLAAEKYGEMSVIASDLSEQIAYALNEY